MTDQQVTDLISKIEILANAMTQRRNSSPVSPADTQPIAAPHNTTDLKSMRERLNHLESDWTDEFNQFLRDEIAIRVNALKEQRKGLTNRLRSDKSLSDAEKQTIRDERDAIVAQIKAIAKKPKQYREQQRLEITSSIQAEEQRELQQEQRRRYQQNVDTANRTRNAAVNNQSAAYENAFVGDGHVIGAYMAESRKAREMRSIMNDSGYGSSSYAGEDSIGMDYWTNVESRFQSDASLRKRLEDFKKSVLDSLMSQIDYIDAQLSDTSQMSSTEVDALRGRRDDIANKYNIAQSSSSLQLMQDTMSATNALDDQDDLVNELRARAKAEFMADYQHRHVRGQNFYGDLEEDDNTDGKAAANVKKRNANIDRIEADIAELSERWDTEFEDYLEKEQWAREAELQRIKEAIQNRLDRDVDLADDVRKKLVDKLKEIDDAISEERGLSARDSKKNSLERERDKQRTARDEAQRVVRQEERKKGKQAFSDFISGGKSGKIGKQGESWVKAGDAMSKVGGKVGKFGGLISKAGGMLTKFAGPVGIAIQAIQMLGEAAKAVAEANAKLMDIQNRRNTARTQRNIERNKLDVDSLVDRLETATTNGVQTLETEGNIAIAKQRVGNTEKLNQIQTQTGTLTDGFNTTAWAALERKISLDAEKQKVEIQAETQRAKAEREIDLRTTQQQNRDAVRAMDAKLVDFELKQTEAELDIEATTYARENGASVAAAMAMGQGTDANAVQSVGGDYGEVGKAYSPSLEGAVAAGIASDLTLGLSSGYTDAYYITQEANTKQALTNEKNLLDTGKAAVESQNRLVESIKSSDVAIQNTTADLTASIKEITIDALAQQKKTYAQFSQKIEKWALNFDKLIRSSASTKGITTKEQGAGYGHFMNLATQNISKQWGFKAEDIIEMQNYYGNNTGRSLIGNESDLYKTAALGRYVGDTKTAVEIANSTEIFNMGMSATIDMTWEMVKKVNKMGLDSRKYIKDMTQNLKMAQKYDFKNGVKSVMEMSKWAQNVRYNMSNLPTILDDIMGGGLEGIITKAAKLQVLGGNFAMGADPLGMAWETYNDPEALAERMNNMTKGMGYWDSKTGQVRFGMADTERLRALAENTGQSLEDVKNQASYHVKSSRIGNALDGRNLSEDQKSSIINKAYYDTEKNDWMVNTVTGGTMSISDVNSDNIANIQAEDYEGKVEQALEHIVSYTDSELGLVESGQAKIADSIIADGTLDEQQQKRYEAQQKFFETSFPETLETVKQNMGDATEAFIEGLFGDVDSIETQQLVALTAVANAVNKVKETVDPIKDDVNAMRTKITETQGANRNTDYEAQLAWSWFLDESNSGNIAGVKSDLASARDQFESGQIDEAKYLELGKKALARGYDDLLDAMEYAGMISNDSKDAVSIEHLNRIIAAMDDGIISGNGLPMSVAASKVTPINDGEIAQTDPNDHAIFAKVGGPFDTLFNKTFVRIDDVYNMLHDSLNPSIEPKEYIPYKDVVIRELSAASGYINTSSNNGGEFRFEPLKVEMSGSLQIDGGNGQSVDLMNVLKENPMILRSLTEMISNAISSQMNGGRGVYNGGRMVSFK